MLYWWYMTDTYNICGKVNRKDPPACLKAVLGFVMLTTWSYARIAQCGQHYKSQHDRLRRD